MEDVCSISFELADSSPMRSELSSNITGALHLYDLLWFDLSKFGSLALSFLLKPLLSSFVAILSVAAKDVVFFLVASH